MRGEGGGGGIIDGPPRGGAPSGAPRGGGPSDGDAFGNGDVIAAGFDAALAVRFGGAMAMGTSFQPLLSRFGAGGGAAFTAGTAGGGGGTVMAEGGGGAMAGPLGGAELGA